MFTRYFIFALFFASIFLFPLRSSAEVVQKYQLTVIGGVNGAIVANDFDADGISLSPQVPVADLRYGGYRIVDAITVRRSSAAPGQVPIGVQVAVLVTRLSSPSYSYIAILQRTQRGYEQVPGKVFKIPASYVPRGFYSISDKLFLTCLYARSALPNQACRLYYVAENTPGAHDPTRDALLVNVHYGLNPVAGDWAISEWMPARVDYRPDGTPSYFRVGYVLASQDNSGHWPSYVYFLPEGNTSRPTTPGVPQNDIYLTSGVAASPSQLPVTTRVINTDWSGYADPGTQQFAGETVIGPTFTGAQYATILCSLYGESGWSNMGLQCVEVNSIRVPENSLTNAARFVNRQYASLNNPVGDFLDTVVEQGPDFFVTNSVQVITSVGSGCNVDGGAVSITDAMLLSQYSLGMTLASEQGRVGILRYCDYRCDGQIGILDVLGVARATLGITPPVSECP